MITSANFLTLNVSTYLKQTLKKEQLSRRQERDLDAKKRKYYEDLEKKQQAVKKRYHDKKIIHKTEQKIKLSRKSNIKN